MNNKKEMSMDDLKDLLMDNEVTNFDPVTEAYRVFDQHGEGALSGDKLRQAFVAYGMGELADEELDILIRVNTLRLSLIFSTGTSVL
jgi:calmodulin